MKRITIFLGSIVLMFASGQMHARVIGSNTSSTRQVAAFFPVGVDNRMVGFSVFEKGILLESSATTCICDAFFPVSGNLVLNGGTLSLVRDLELKSPFSMGPGKIDGNGSCALSYPGNVAGISIPSANHERLLRFASSVDTGSSVNSVDWSSDNAYIAVACQGLAGNAVQIYHVSDLVMTLTAGIDLGSDSALSVHWHPSAYYLAVGRSAGDGIEIYFLDVASGQLQKKSGVALSAVNAVAWRPQGNALAVGRVSHSEMMVCDVADGIVGTSYTATYSSEPGVTRAVQKNAIDWDATGEYVAVGLSVHSSDSELKIFSFDAGALARCAELEIGATVYAAQWHPTLPYIALGISSGADRIALYSFNAETMAFVNLAAQAGLANNVYGLHWNDAGTHLAAVSASSSLAYNFSVFAFDPVSFTLNVASGFREATTMGGVCWAHDGESLCIGKSNNQAQIFSYDLYPCTFKNINVFIDSDVTIASPVVFEGSCLVDGGWNTFTFGSNGALIIADGGSLYLENAVIKGITADRIACAGNSSVLSLRNVVWDQDDIYTFSVGSMRLSNDILMSGNTQFVYSSAQTSTVLAHSELTLDLDFTLSYDPGIPSKNLFVLEDATSKLSLNGATLHATVTGMELTTGNVRVLRDSIVSCETQEVLDELLEGSFLIDEGISFGDGVSEHDVALDVYGGVSLQLTAGSLCYKNVNTSSLRLHNIYSSLYAGTGSILKLYQTMNLGPGVLVFGDESTVAQAPGKTIVGSIQPRGRYYSTELAV